MESAPNFNRSMVALTRGKCNTSAQIFARRTSVAVCGLRTEQCVETTARLASDLGYEVTFLTDATGTFPIPHRAAPADRPLDEMLADPRTLAAADVVARTEYALAGRFATIATVTEPGGAAGAAGG